jgi:hypothetical protein
VQRHHRYAFNKWETKNTMGNGAEQILVGQRAWRINRRADRGSRKAAFGNTQKKSEVVNVWSGQLKSFEGPSKMKGEETNFFFKVHSHMIPSRSKNLTISRPFVVSGTAELQHFLTLPLLSIGRGGGGSSSAIYSKCMGGGVEILSNPL